MAGRVVAIISLVVVYMIGNVESTDESKEWNPKPTEFISTLCKDTRYPEKCVKSLSRYGLQVQKSEHKLAVAAVTLSESKTRLCAAFLKENEKAEGTKHGNSSAVTDCVETISDSAERLSESIRELKGLDKARGNAFLLRVSDVQTWVTAALTDQNTCLDILHGHEVDPKLKTNLTSRVTDISEFTSIALALVNRFASTQRT
ncbi:hypothetical protein VNO77_24917 [Canavalia gladiata]|uniref:Pectinesterase inhibitor domain-containing protein n=1 Tax=Canavalia gladiata TaxID=3824 RepID=A0AAN9L7Q3_CANGL